MIRRKLFALPVRAILLVLAVGLASLAFWRSHSLLERSHLQKMTAAHARTVQLDIVEEIEYCVRGQIQLARLLEEDPHRDNWEYQARLFLRDNPGFLDEQWIDSAFQVRWSVSESESNQDISLESDVVLLSVLRNLMAHGEKDASSFTPPFSLGNGDSARRIVVPIYQNERLTGFSIATVDRRKLFEEILEDQIGVGYGLSVSDDNQEVYTTGISREKEGQWTRTEEFLASGLPLRVRIWPEDSLLTGSKTMLVQLSLAAGALIGLLVFAALELATTSYLQSQELRKSRDELDARVQERTAELASLNDKLEAEIYERKQAQESLQELTRRVLQIRDQEQRRIGRELHDSTVQTLCALVIDLERLEHSIANGDRSKVQRLLAISRELAEQVTTEVRTISYLMHPPVLDDLGLEGALPWYAVGFASRSGIHTHVNVQPELGRYSKEAELTLYRIVQEALTNIHRHSGSPTANICLFREKNHLTLQITDCGRGIPAQVLEPNGNSRAIIGVGIAGMRERVRHLNGDLLIESTHCGTTIKVTLPVECKQVSEQVKGSRDIELQPSSQSEPAAKESEYREECA